MSEVIETRPLCKQPGLYVGWPTVARAPNGTIHAVFSGDRDGHICPFGKSLILSSGDEGRTWTEPRVANDTPLDDRDTGLCVLPDGTLVMSWFTSYYYRSYEVIWAGYRDSTKYGSKGMVLPWAAWEARIAGAGSHLDAWVPFIHSPAPEEVERWKRAREELDFKSAVETDARFPIQTRRLGYWTRRSGDGGQTWDGATLAPVSAPHGPNLLPDGRLIYIGTATWSGDLGVAVSSNQGLGWNIQATIGAQVGKGGVSARLCEPHVVAAPSGKLIGMARYQAALPGEERFLWQFDSEDGGMTWTEPRPTTLNGYPPHLLRVSDGRLLASFSVRHAPLGHRFCFSHDEGSTWEVDGQLHVGSDLGDLGYVATTETSPGRFLSVYYQRDRSDEKPCLMMTRWKG